MNGATIALTLALATGTTADADPVQRARRRTAPPPPTNWLVGSPADAAGSPVSGLLLAGGGSDVDAAMAWFAARAGGGDIVVLRASGTDGYNPYLFALAPVDSVQTFRVDSRLGADHPDLIRAVDGAEAVFIAGGDQSDYVRCWKGTRLARAIARVLERGVSVGGTSAGLAILGEFDFAAIAGTLTSDDALVDPYGERVALERDFLTAPRLAATITDSHFAARDRMGRLVAFLARIVTDGWAASPRGLGIDEATAVTVEPSGQATVLGDGAAYLVAAPGPPERCSPGAPLTYRGVPVLRVPAGAGFDVGTWSSQQATAYTVSAEAGALTSSGGPIY